MLMGGNGASTIAVTSPVVERQKRWCVCEIYSDSCLCFLNVLDFAGHINNILFTRERYVPVEMKERIKKVSNQSVT